MRTGLKSGQGGRGEKVVVGRESVMPFFLMLTGSVLDRAGLHWAGSGFRCHFPEHKGPFSAANHNQMCTDLLKEP